MNGKWFLVGLLVLTSIGGAMAGEFWQEKAYSKWTQEEAWQLLMDSPWAQRIPGETRMEEMDAYAASPRAGLSREVPSGAGSEPHFYVVRWSSAQIVREAVARLQVLEGRLTPEQANQFLSQQPSPHIVITVLASDPAAFEGLTAEGLGKDAHLRAKKEKVRSERIIPVRSTSEQVTAVEFYFPRARNGQPLIEMGLKQVQFQCRSRHQYIRAKFDPRKMERNDFPDL